MVSDTVDSLAVNPNNFNAGLFKVIKAPLTFTASLLSLVVIVNNGSVVTLPLISLILVCSNVSTLNLICFSCWLYYQRCKFTSIILLFDYFTK